MDETWDGKSEDLLMLQYRDWRVRQMNPWVVSASMLRFGLVCSEVVEGSFERSKAGRRESRNICIVVLL